jgi:transcriptional antiterminator RfaH
MQNYSLAEFNRKLVSRWYVVHTRQHAERRVADHLRAQGFAVFLPLQNRTIRHARQFRTKAAPLFTRYLFVRLTEGRDRWRSVNGTFGVSHLVMEGDRPKPVPAGVVEELIAFADSVGVLSSAPVLKSGEMVRIVRGPLTGFVGRLLSLDETHRVRLLVEILGNSTPVEMSAEAGLVSAA